MLFQKKNKFSEKKINKTSMERNIQVEKELIHLPFKLFEALLIIIIIIIGKIIIIIGLNKWLLRKK